MKTKNILMATPLTAFALSAEASVTLTAPKDAQHNVAYRVKNLLMAYGQSGSFIVLTESRAAGRQKMPTFALTFRERFEPIFIINL